MGTEPWRATLLPVESLNIPVQNGEWPAETSSSGEELLSWERVSLKPAQFLQLCCNPGSDGFWIKQNRKQTFFWKTVCNPGFCEASYWASQFQHICRESKLYGRAGRCMWDNLSEIGSPSTEKGITLPHPTQQCEIVMRIPNVIF